MIKDVAREEFARLHRLSMMTRLRMMAVERILFKPFGIVRLAFWFVVSPMRAERIIDEAHSRLMVEHDARIKSDALRKEMTQRPGIILPTNGVVANGNMARGGGRHG